MNGLQANHEFRSESNCVPVTSLTTRFMSIQFLHMCLAPKLHHSLNLFQIRGLKFFLRPHRGAPSVDKAVSESRASVKLSGHFSARLDIFSDQTKFWLPQKSLLLFDGGVFCWIIDVVEIELMSVVDMNQPLNKQEASGKKSGIQAGVGTPAGATQFNDEAGRGSNPKIPISPEAEAEAGGNSGPLINPRSFLRHVPPHWRPRVIGLLSWGWCVALFSLAGFGGYQFGSSSVSYFGFGKQGMTLSELSARPETFEDNDVEKTGENIAGVQRGAEANEIFITFKRMVIYEYFEENNKDVKRRQFNVGAQLSSKSDRHVATNFRFKDTQSAKPLDNGFWSVDLKGCTWRLSVPSGEKLKQYSYEILGFWSEPKAKGADEFLESEPKAATNGCDTVGLFNTTVYFHVDYCVGVGKELEGEELGVKPIECPTEQLVTFNK